MLLNDKGKTLTYFSPFWIWKVEYANISALWLNTLTYDCGILYDFALRNAHFSRGTGFFVPHFLK